MFLEQQSTDSVWQQGAADLAYPALVENWTTDVAIVGGGITGLTTAYLLQEAGFRVCVLESKTIGAGVSGWNSGHLTSLLLDMDYTTIIKNFGEEKAKIVGESQIVAIQMIAEIIARHNINCDFKFVDGYRYAENDDEVIRLEKEYQAAIACGIPCQWVDTVPLPFPVKGAIKVPQQARFHPLRYIQGLAELIVRGGNAVFEHTPVVNIDHKRGIVEAESGLIAAPEGIVLATHTPIGLVPGIQTRLEPVRSYMIGARLGTDQTIGDALFWDMKEPYHYTRLVEDDNGNAMVVIGGEDHKTGEKEDNVACFEKLALYAYDHYGPITVENQWSAQLYDPVDGLPYIGRIKNGVGVYVATGFSGEGLTGGTYAAKIISDLIRGVENSWAEIYSPSRVKIASSIAGFMAENVATVAHFVGDRLKRPETDDMNAVETGEGKMIEVDGKKVAAYRDEEGELHMVSPVCTHMGCIVGWNAVEKSWDCPCHGGRFDCKGQVLNGPPVKGLEPFFFE